MGAVAMKQHAVRVFTRRQCSSCQLVCAGSMKQQAVGVCSRCRCSTHTDSTIMEQHRAAGRRWVSHIDLTAPHVRVLFP